MNFVDLHLHTIFSDGHLEPKDVVELAYEAKLSAFAVTDHDSIAGIAEAHAAARVLGLEMIPGIELSTSRMGIDFHILGYFIDLQNQELLDYLDLLKTKRQDRIRKICYQLNKAGVQLDPALVFLLSPKGVVGRLHVARALINEGFAYSIYDAFDRFLGEGKPGYVTKEFLSIPDTIDLIHRAGGFAFWAHPGLSYNSESFTRLLEWGIDGLEVHHPKHDERAQKFFLELAEKHELLICGGSDFHFSDDFKAGIGDIVVPYEIVTRMKDRLDAKSEK